MQSGGPPGRGPWLPAHWADRLFAALAHGAAGFILSDETALGDQPALAVRQLTRVLEAWLQEQTPRPREQDLAIDAERLQNDRKKEPICSQLTTHT